MIGQGRVSESSSTGSNTPHGCSNSQASEQEEIVTWRQKRSERRKKERKEEKRQRSHEKRGEKEEKRDRRRRRPISPYNRFYTHNDEHKSSETRFNRGISRDASSCPFSHASRTSTKTAQWEKSTHRLRKNAINCGIILISGLKHVRPSLVQNTPIAPLLN